MSGPLWSFCIEMSHGRLLDVGSPGGSKQGVDHAEISLRGSINSLLDKIISQDEPRVGRIHYRDSFRFRNGMSMQKASIVLAPGKQPVPIVWRTVITVIQRLAEYFPVSWAVLRIATVNSGEIAKKDRHIGFGRLQDPDEFIDQRVCCCDWLADADFAQHH